MKKEELTKKEIEDKKFYQSLGRIAESSDYWAIKKLLSDAEEKLNSVLSVNTSEQSVEKIATQLLSHQKAIAIIREMIKKPFTMATSRGEPKKYNFE